MKTSALSFITVLCLALAGCMPESVNPIAPASQSFTDPRIEGVWVTYDDSSREPTYYHFQHRRSEGQDKKVSVSNWLDIVGIAHHSKGTLDLGGYAALPARIGGRTYLSYANKERPDKADTSSNFYFARYEFDWRGQLKIHLADNNAFVEAVQAGQLRGKVKSNQYGTDVKITDTSEHIAAFVEKADDKKLFGGKPMVLRRVR